MMNRRKVDHYLNSETKGASKSSLYPSSQKSQNYRRKNDDSILLERFHGLFGGTKEYQLNKQVKTAS